MDEVDPIEEIHRVRQKIFAEVGEDLGAYLEYMRSFEKLCTRPVVSFSRADTEPMSVDCGTGENEFAKDVAAALQRIREKRLKRTARQKKNKQVAGTKAPASRGKKRQECVSETAAK